MEIGIRSSLLAGWFDCERRNVARSFTHLIIDQFPDVRRRQTRSIGAEFGTSAHAGATEYVKARRDGSALSIDEAVTIANNELRKRFTDDVETDTTTGNLDTASIQLSRALQAMQPLLNTIDAEHVETSLRAKLDTDFVLTGQFDVRERSGVVRDFKFGKNLSQYEAQLGSYSLLAQSNNIPVSGLKVDWVKRAARTKPQPAPLTIEYNKNTAETAAIRTAERIMSAITKFKETGDPWSFSANNSSMMCSQTWCPAWGTSFCDLGKEKHDTTQGEF